MKKLDSRFHGNDKIVCILTFYETVFFMLLMFFGHFKIRNILKLLYLKNTKTSECQILLRLEITNKANMLYRSLEKLKRSGWRINFFSEPGVTYWN